MPPRWKINEFQNKSIIWTFQDEKVIGGTHLTTVAIFTKMRIFQICFLQWVTTDARRLKKVKEQRWTPRWCAGAACQLLPRGAWRKSVFFTQKCRYFNSVFYNELLLMPKGLKKVVEQNWTSEGCAGAACQLLPRGAWWKSTFQTQKYKYFNSVFMQ